MAMKKILLIEREAEFSEAVTTHLQCEKYEVVSTDDENNAITLFRRERPQLVLLGRMISKDNPYELCRTIRNNWDTPIIIMEESNREADKILGFDMGADDYMSMPLSLKELTKRIDAILRRTFESKRMELQVRQFNNGELMIEYNARQVIKKGEDIKLTKNEFEILSLLSTHPNQIFTREHIISFIYKDFAGYDRAIDSHIKNLRKKIETDTTKPEYIKTVHGVGYRFIGSITKI